MGKVITINLCCVLSHLDILNIQDLNRQSPFEPRFKGNAWREKIWIYIQHQAGSTNHKLIMNL